MNYETSQSKHCEPVKKGEEIAAIVCIMPNKDMQGIDIVVTDLTKKKAHSVRSIAELQNVLMKINVEMTEMVRIMDFTAERIRKLEHQFSAEDDSRPIFFGQ